MFPDFEEVHSAVTPHLDELESHRQDLIGQIKKHGLVTLGVILFSLLLIAFLPDAIVVVGGAFVIYLVFIAFKLYNRYQAFRLEFKEKVVATLSKQILDLSQLENETEEYEYKCHYDHNRRVSDTHIYNSKLFPARIDEIKGEDLFQGVLGLTDFQFSEITLVEIRKSTNAKGHTTRKRVKLFDGILFVADFHKDFDGITTLTSANFVNNSFLGHFSLFSDLKKMDLESAEFNRAFHVRSTDETKARYLLSSSMMERILQFKAQHHQKIEISFVNSRMCIALSSGKNYFEPSLFNPMDKQQTRSIYDDLTFFFGMIEEFDLNTRIWNK